MKTLALFLTVYILVLCGAPCADHILTGSIHPSESCSDHGQSGQDNADYCSPFCTCQCCQTTVQVPFTPPATFIPATTIRFHEASPRFENLELFDFLIPPKA